eukprot:6491266-Amphidinium_carterae.1
MKMRLTEVHKPLVSAHRALKANAAYMTEAGGMLFPQDSVPRRKLEGYANKLWYKYENLAVPLYQENGVYNLYVNPSLASRT